PACNFSSANAACALTRCSSARVFNGAGGLVSRNFCSRTTRSAAGNASNASNSACAAACLLALAGRLLFGAIGFASLGGCVSFDVGVGVGGALAGDCAVCASSVARASAGFGCTSVCAGFCAVGFFFAGLCVCARPTAAKTQPMRTNRLSVEINALFIISFPFTIVRPNGSYACLTNDKRLAHLLSNASISTRPVALLGGCTRNRLASVGAMSAGVAACA